MKLLKVNKSPNGNDVNSEVLKNYYIVIDNLKGLVKSPWTHYHLQVFVIQTITDELELY